MTMFLTEGDQKLSYLHVFRNFCQLLIYHPLYVQEQHCRYLKASPDFSGYYEDVFESIRGIPGAISRQENQLFDVQKVSFF